MKASVFVAPNLIEFDPDYPDPVIDDGFIMKVKASGICTTDLKALSGNRPGMQPPMVLGHEFSGVIVESVMDKFPSSTRVAVAPYAGCGICDFCLDDREDLCYQKVFVSGGAFAEKVSIPKSLAEKTAWVIPDLIPYEEAALAEPLACVILSLRSCGWQPGQNILIVGAGFMGLLHVLLASAWGANKILVSEPDPFRRALAEKLGANAVDPQGEKDLPKWAKTLTNGNGPDVVITAVGIPNVVESFIDVARPGGVVHIFGGLPKSVNLSVSAYTIHYKSVSLIGTSGYRTKDYILASEMISNSLINLKPLITDSFSLEEAAGAFAKAKQIESIKVVVKQ